MDKVLLSLRRITVTANWMGMTIMLPLMCLVVTVSVFMRYVLRQPIFGADEMAGFLLLMVFYFSLAHCWSEEGHIRSKLLTSRLGSRWVPIVDLWASALVLGFTLVLIYALFEDTIFCFKVHKVTIDAEIPLWPFLALATMGSLLLGGAVLASLIGNFSKIRKRRGTKNES